MQQSCMSQRPASNPQTYLRRAPALGRARAATGASLRKPIFW